MVVSSVDRDIALTQAALDHAIYFMELGANERAAAYFQFAAQKMQGIAKHLVLDSYIPPSPVWTFHESGELDNAG
jgi:hypothetical protein